MGFLPGLPAWASSFGFLKVRDSAMTVATALSTTEEGEGFLLEIDTITLLMGLSTAQKASLSCW